jgi:hypothetical protein
MIGFNLSDAKRSEKLVNKQAADFASTHHKTELKLTQKLPPLESPRLARIKIDPWTNYSNIHLYLRATKRPREDKLPEFRVGSASFRRISLPFIPLSLQSRSGFPAQAVAA